MKLFDEIKAKVEALVREVDGEAKAELKQAVDDAEEQVTKVQGLLQQFKADAETAVAAAEPSVKTAVEALVQKLLQDAQSVFHG